MTTDIDWYFDVISPYAYLQYRFLATHPLRARIRPQPVLFAALLNHYGQLGPAEIEPKREFTYRHVLWLAARQGQPMRMPRAHPFNPLALLRMIVAGGCAWAMIEAAFSFAWIDGHTPDDGDALDQLLSSCSMDKDRLSQPEIKDSLRERTQRAIDRGVFGVPTLVAGDRLFWGHDATRMCLDWLQDPAGFQRWEHGLAGLPTGVVRSRRAGPD